VSFVAYGVFAENAGLLQIRTAGGPSVRHVVKIAQLMAI
jgi:hypothetical protein